MFFFLAAAMHVARFVAFALPLNFLLQAATAFFSLAFFSLACFAAFAFAFALLLLLVLPPAFPVEPVEPLELCVVVPDNPGAPGAQLMSPVAHAARPWAKSGATAL